MLKLTSRVCIWLILSIAALPHLSADTVILTSEERVEGKVIEETPEQVTIEQRISAGVTDTVVIPRAGIKKIEKEPLDEADFRPLKNMKPGPNWLRPEEHDAAIAQLKNFVLRYPLSSHVADVRALLDVYEKERARVMDGAVKFHGEWLTADQADKQREEIQGEVYYDAMKELAARGDLIGALNYFDALERQSPGARAYPDGVELALRLIVTIEPDIERRLLTIKTDFDKLTLDYKTMNEQQRIEVSNALTREYARLDAGLAAAEKAKLKWVPLQPRSKKSLEKLKATIQTEKPRLAALSPAKMLESIRLASTAARELAANDIAGADNDLKTALVTWPQNALAARVGKDIAARKADMPKSATPKPTPTPAATPKPAPKPGSEPTPKPKKSWFSFGVVTVIGAAQPLSRP